MFYWSHNQAYISWLNTHYPHYFWSMPRTNHFEEHKNALMLSRRSSHSRAMSCRVLVPMRGEQGPVVKGLGTSQGIWIASSKGCLLMMWFGFKVIFLICLLFGQYGECLVKKNFGVIYIYIINLKCTISYIIYKMLLKYTLYNILYRLYIVDG